MKNLIVKAIKYIFKIIVMLLKIIFIMPLIINKFRANYDIDELDKDIKSL